MLRVAYGTKLAIGFVSFGLAAGLFAAVNGASAADFYKGKTLTILIGHSLGGSYGGYARLITLHMSKHIAGNPKIIVQSRPGGGGRKATTYFFRKAPTDGTMIALLPDTLTHSQLLEPKRAKWDMRKVNYIGRIATSHTAFGVRADTGIKDIKGLLNTPVKFGCSGRTSGSAQVPLLVKNLDGAKFQMVCGYRGSAPFILALERNEINALAMNLGTWQAKLGDKIKSGEYKLLMQAGLKPNKLIPDIPLIQNVVGNEQSKKVYAWVGIASDIGRSLIGAPNMPKARLDELRSAFTKLTNDPVFVADVKKRGFPFDPLEGAAIEKMRDQVFKVDKKTIDVANKAMSLGYKKACINCGKKKKKKK